MGICYVLMGHLFMKFLCSAPVKILMFFPFAPFSDLSKMVDIELN